MNNENNMGDLDLSPDQFVERSIPEFLVRTKDCILHKGNTDKDGYGYVSYNTKDRKAHRIAYRESYGEIPEGMMVRHKCDVRNCINPAHLELGYPKDNSQDMVNRGRSLSGEYNPSAKLKIVDVNFIRFCKKLITQKRLGEMFNMNPESIGLIQRGLSWKSV